MTSEIIEDLYETMLDRHGYTKEQISEEEVSINIMVANKNCVSVKWKLDSKTSRHIGLLIMKFIRENVETPAEMKALYQHFGLAKTKGCGTYRIPKAELYTSETDMDRLKTKALAHIEKELKHHTP